MANRVAAAQRALKSLARRVLGRARPDFAGMSHVEGVCNICGHATSFYYTDPALYRESLICRECRSSSRYRSIARGVLRFVRERTGIAAPSVAALPRHAGATLAVYDTQVPFRYGNLGYPIPSLLARCCWIDLHVSRWTTSRPLGAELGPNATNQNLEQLTWPDARFDLVITSDVMEHVRVDQRAHREIRRVLRAGGVYLFTVPHHRGAETFHRIDVVDPDDPSRDVALAPPEYHGDANAADGQGALAYRAYGAELDDELRGLGFEVEYLNADVPEHGILNTELFYCRLR